MPEPGRLSSASATHAYRSSGDSPDTTDSCSDVRASVPRNVTVVSPSWASTSAASRLRRKAGVGSKTDPWDRLVALPPAQLLPVLEEVAKTLPLGVMVKPVYERTWLVDRVVQTAGASQTWNSIRSSASPIITAPGWSAIASGMNAPDSSSFSIAT